MSILNYYKHKERALPNPQGPLSRVIPSNAIAFANSEVRQVIDQARGGEKTRKRRKGISPRVYSPKERAEIGKLACSVGATEVAKRFTKKLGFSVNESTVRSMKKAYLTKLREKRLREDDDLTILELPIKKKGRSLLLGPVVKSSMKQCRNSHVLNLRDYGCPINTSIVITVARGLGEVIDRTRLATAYRPTTFPISRPQNNYSPINVVHTSPYMW